LSLSILRNIASMTEVFDLKLIEMFDKFIEIENASLLDPKFCPLVKSVLIECKVLMESVNPSEQVKKVRSKLFLDPINDCH
jgi:hypothetical protein